MAIDNPFKNPKPFDIGQIIGTPDLKNVSYTAFDFYSIKARVFEYIKKYFPDDFNDFVESDLGIMLTELWAYMADLICFKADMNANEVYIDTVSQAKNVHRIAKLINYPIRPPRAATSRMSATVEEPYGFDIKINRGYSISVPSQDSNPLIFELYSADENWNPIFDEDIFVPAGSSSNLSIVALEGTSTYTNAISDGSKFQTISPVQSNVLDGSIQVTVNNQRWYQVDFFSDSDCGPYYMVEYDENYRTMIMFADDVKGKIPPQGSDIVINYRFGGGSRGNINAGYINQIMNVTSDIVPGPVPVNIRNYTSGQGGENAETIEEIKSKIPLWNKSQNRAVSGEDYSFLAESFSTLYHGRVGKALAVLRNSGCSGNIIDLYVLQMDTETTLKTANSTLKGDLTNFINSKKMLTDFVCIKDASQVFQNININISVSKFYYEFKKDIYDKIVQAVSDFFDLNRWRIGQPLKKYDLVQYLNSIPNIASISIAFVANSQNLVSDPDMLVVDFWKIVRPGIMNINIDTVN